jgi:hypothetical protein
MNFSIVSCPHRARFLFFTLGILFSNLAFAISTPATLIISGTIEKGTIAPRQNDRIYAVQNNGQIAGIGSVQDNSGFYAIQISKDTDFNGTELSLQLEQAGVRYQLLDNGKPVSFVFSGGLFPVTLSLALTVGPKVGGSSSGSGSGSGSPSIPSGGGSNNNNSTTSFDSRFDVNNDGKLTQDDIDAVKNAVAHNTKLKAADVNSDGLYNTRDIIEIIKAYLKNRRSR